jgi:3-mercaptopyruvate sulfurtransferase SseA
LAELGYTNVKDFAGGKQGWIDAGLPLETDDEIDPQAATEPEPATP